MWKAKAVNTGEWVYGCLECNGLGMYIVSKTATSKRSTLIDPETLERWKPEDGKANPNT